MNLKKTRFKKLSDEVDGEKFTVNISGSDAFKAGDLNQFMTGFKVLNPELVIARMNPEANLHITLTIQKGRGYVPADENRQVESEIGVIAIDSIFTPMRNVKYSVENYRVEQKTDYEKLIIEISTDGSIHPKDALKEAAKILIYHFMLFSDEKNYIGHR